MISSKGNAYEMQNLRENGNFHVPCKETYALARYMAISISMYLEMKHTARYMEISMHIAKETYGKVHGHFDTLPYVSLQGTLSVVLRKSARKFPCISVSLLPKATWKLKVVEHILQLSTLSILSSLRQCVHS